MKESFALDNSSPGLVNGAGSACRNVIGLSPSARSVSDERHLHCDSALEADVEYITRRQSKDSRYGLSNSVRGR